LPDARPCRRFTLGLKPDSGTKSPKVVSARGAIPAETAQAILTRLKEKGAGGDELERHLIVEEAMAGGPITAGNSATLLQDGPATYKSMFSAIERARDHVNIEFYMIEPGETGDRFASLLLAKRKRGRGGRSTCA
jgi:cardiolipin synthase